MRRDDQKHPHCELRATAISAVLLVLLLASSPTASAPSPWSPTELRFFDDLRSPHHTHITKTRPDSSVVEVALVNRTDQHAPDKNPEVYRLCHLTSMLWLSKKSGKLGYGLQPEGSALLAMLHFNHKIDTIVPDLRTNEQIRDCNVRFTMEYQDTEGSPIAANRVLIEDVLSRVHGLNSPRPIALVGASRSAVSAALSIKASAHSLPVVSPGLSESSFLDNKGTYGLFGRTNPGSRGDARIAAAYLRNVLGATHCGVLYVNDEFGRAYGADFARAAFELDVAIVAASYEYSADGSRESIATAVAQLAASGLNYFFAVFLGADFDQVMEEGRKAGIIGKGKFWLLYREVATFTGYETTESDLAESMNGLTYLSKGFKNGRFEEAWGTLEGDESLKEYFISKQPEHLNMSNFKFPSSPDSWQYLAYDTVMALGFAACQAHDYFFDGASLFRALTKTSFQGASGRVDFVESTASRDPTNVPYRVMNAVASEPRGGEGGITFAAREVARMVGGEWKTTRPTTYADGSSEAPPVLPPQEEIRHAIGVGALATGLTLAGLVMAASLFWGTWTVVHRRTHVVQLSQPAFLLVLCAGTLIMAATVIPLSLQEPVSQKALDTACMAAPWLYSIGFILTFSALFSKTAKVNKLFNRGRRLKRIRMQAKEFLLPFILLLTFTVIVLIAWTLAAPLTWQRIPVGQSVDRYGREVEFYASCQSEDGKSELVFVILLFAIDVCSLVFAVYESYRARNIATDYNESTYIAISILCILEACTIGLPVLLAVNPDQTSEFVIMSMLICAMCVAVLFPLFVPKELARRKEMAEMKGEGKSSKLVREWQVWQELKAKNESLKNELDHLKSSKAVKTMGSTGTVDESFIYFDLYSNNHLQEESKISLNESSQDDDSEEWSQTQQPWGAGLDQLCL